MCCYGKMLHHFNCCINVNSVFWLQKIHLIHPVPASVLILWKFQYTFIFVNVSRWKLNVTKNNSWGFLQEFSNISQLIWEFSDTFQFSKFRDFPSFPTFPKIPDISQSSRWMDTLLDVAKLFTRCHVFIYFIIMETYLNIALK